jgi:hypothetical protein
MNGGQPNGAGNPLNFGNPLETGNPFQSPAVPQPELGSPSPFRPSRFGDYMNRAFTAYAAHWSEWLLPLLVAGMIALVASLACGLPYLLVQGPLTCGLFACAFRSLRGGQVEVATLGRGWDVCGRAIVTAIALFLLQLIPMAVMMGVIFAAIAVFAGTAGPNPKPDDATMAALFVGGIACYFALFFVILVWTYWIGTRTMFIWPLVADRSYDFFAAWSESWAATRVRFWELILLYFLATLIATLGIYLCYVGIIFTLPLYFLIVGAVYEDRFGIASV